MTKVIEVPNYGLVEFPDDMTDEQIVRAIKKNAMGYKQAKPDYESVLNEGSTLKVGPFDTGIGISPQATQFLAGMGKRFMDIGTLGLRQEADSEKALMDKGWAKAGSAVGDLTTLLGGGAAIRGVGTLANLPKVASVGKAMAMPSTLPVAAGTAALYGAATTNGDLADRAKEGAIGAAAAGVVPVLGAMYQGGKALVEPLKQSGQEAIAARTLRRFAGENADDVARTLAAPEIMVPGSIPTAAEASGNAGIAALQNGLANLDKGGFGNALSQRAMDNRAARVSALEGIAKDEATRLASKESRDSAANALYGKAFASDQMRRDLAKQAATDVSPFSGLGVAQPALDMPSPGLQMLAKRPAFKAAIQDASVSLQNRGMDNLPLSSLEGLHRIKLSIDEAINGAGEGSALARYSKSDLKEIKKQLVNEIEKLSPTYQAARDTYKDMSRPINQMEIGQELVDRLRPALGDFGANTRETAASFAKAVRDADATAAKVTKFKDAKLTDIMEPDQMAAITGVARDLARKAQADDLVKGVGSNTAQNLATQNVLRQAFGPLGLPQSFAESAMLQTVFKPLSLLYSGVGEQRIADALAKGLLDPQEAARLIQMSQQQRRLPGLLDALPAVGGAIGVGVTQ